MLCIYFWTIDVAVVQQAVDEVKQREERIIHQGELGPEAPFHSVRRQAMDVVYKYRKLAAERRYRVEPHGGTIAYPCYNP